MDESSSSDLDMWKEIQESFGGSTLIGAHLSPIGYQLGAFLADLEQARENLDADLKYSGIDEDTDLDWRVRQSIDNAIANVRIASQLVDQAQQAIVSVFPT